MFRNLRLLFFVLILAAGFGFLVFQWRIYHQIPKNYEWNAVEGWLKEQADFNDLILFEPEWLAGFAQDFGRFKPYSVVNRNEILKKNYPPASKLWLISMFKDSSLAPKIKKAGFLPEESHNIYSVWLTPTSVPSKNVTYRFIDHLPEAKVFIDKGDGKIVKAEWQNQEWVFSDNPVDWNRVSVRAEPFGRRIHRCIWFHPLEAGVKTLQYDKVPLGKRIELGGGMADSGLQTPPGAPVYLFIQIDGREVGNFEFHDIDRKFHHLLDTSSLSGNEGRVSFQVQTSDQSARHFCFSAWSLEE